ncbi:MAG: TIGR03016 family PEP-CTERM system-associated outer membrane protein [Duganella sp.]
MATMISPAPHRASMLALLSLPLLPAWPTTAAAVDWTVVPTVRVRESYTDNVNLAPPAQAQGELSTEFSPGIALDVHDGPRLQLALSYAWHAVTYQRRRGRSDHQLDASAHAEVLPGWLYLGARSNISLQNISGFGPRQLDPAQDASNSQTVRAHSFSPYLQHYFRGLATATLRYDVQRVDSGRLLQVTSDAANLRLLGDNGGRGWNWDLMLDRRHVDDSALAPVTMSDAALTLSYPVNSTLGAFATGGYEQKDYHATSRQPEGKYWSAGGNWAPSPRTRVSASFGRRYFGRTYALDAAYRMRSMAWTVTYHEDITTMHAQFFSIAPAGLSDFLYQLWETKIPDPQKRLQSIKVFLLISQMLGTDGNVNFFSHRYYLQKSLRVASVYSGTRGALAFNLARTDRTAQTSSAVDSILTGPDELTLEDRTRQSAAQAGWNWRLSARTGVTVGASHSRAQSLTTGRQDRNSVLSATFSHQLRPGLGADIHLRHSRHASNAGGNYRENGVGAAVTAAF